MDNCTFEEKPNPIVSKRSIIGIPDYCIKEVIRKEDFACVYSANKDDETEIVNIKVLSKSNAIELEKIESIKHEVQALRSSGHPFVVRMIELRQDEKRLYIIMEHVEGQSLKSLIKREKLNKDGAVFFAAQTLLALQYLHSLDIVHRNVHPQNIIIDSEKYIKLTNFSSAKHLKNQRTYTTCGSAEYLAPEIINDAGQGQEVDWWAFGILIYEMLTGADPFYNNDPMVMYQNIVNCKLEFPANFDKTAKSLIKFLLVTDPAERANNVGPEACNLRYHKWFKDTNWRLLLDKRATSTYKLLPVNYEITDKKPECYEDNRDFRPVDALKDPFLDW